ncbi:MBL fold metallo-hydrolase [Desulforhopalus sp. IMCC35007]|uniref:MBL fold metallo-hydrolase n=1 Tax=Desulforhopalus sp. IMCC35007 TaxID=2569543 RepID=UPI0010AE06BB|nr:MBL fold metallo-hydrolase [Desulforhopalus sp. IMCC35007]TKB09109.1 MBL fold metallo-hydrolase [Desulforhopalus sp. IMCC35007]
MACSTMKLGAFDVFWLPGGTFRLDGGTMFGPVPKVLWSKKYSVAADNTIEMCNDPLFIVAPDRKILIDTGLGVKLTQKQNAIFQVGPQWSIPAALSELGYSCADVTDVVLTHCDFDHAGGLEMVDAAGENIPVFGNAQYWVQKDEWEDVQNPDIRAEATYLPENFVFTKGCEGLKLVAGRMEICPGVTVVHTGGHTRGHQMVEISSDGEVAVHLGDLFPTTAHVNPLWVMAYDNFPLEVIQKKRELFAQYSRQKAWFTLYHDPLVGACRLDDQCRIIEKKLR